MVLVSIREHFSGTFVGKVSSNLFLVKKKNSLLSKVLVSIGGRGSGSTLLVMSLVELVDLE